jgi:hypothetical protein
MTLNFALGISPTALQNRVRLGPNILFNGSFDVDTSGWTIPTPQRGVGSWDAGRLKLDATLGDGVAPTVRQSGLIINAGETWEVKWTASTDDGATTSGFVVEGSVGQPTAFGMGSFTERFTAAAGGTYLQLYGTGLKTVYFDNVSLRRVHPTFGPERVLNPSFDDDMSNWTGVGATGPAVQDAGVMRLTAGAATGGRYQDVAFDANTPSRSIARIRKVSGTSYVRISVFEYGGFTASLGSELVDSSDWVDVVIDASPSTAGVRLYIQMGDGDAVAEVDHFSNRLIKT